MRAKWSSARRSETKHAPRRESTSRPAKARRSASSRWPSRWADGSSPPNDDSTPSPSASRGGSSASDALTCTADSVKAASRSGTSTAAGCNRTPRRRPNSSGARSGEAATLSSTAARQLQSRRAAGKAGGEWKRHAPLSRRATLSALSASLNSAGAAAATTVAGSTLRSVDRTSEPRSTCMPRSRNAKASLAVSACSSRSRFPASSSLASTIVRCSVLTSTRVSASVYSPTARAAQSHGGGGGMPAAARGAACARASLSAMLAAEMSAAGRSSCSRTAANALRAATKSPRALAAWPVRISMSQSASPGKVATGSGGGGPGGGASSSRIDGALTAMCASMRRPCHQEAACSCSASAAASIAGRTLDSRVAAAAHSEGGSRTKPSTRARSGGVSCSRSRPTWQRSESASPPMHSVASPSSTHARTVPADGALGPLWDSCNVTMGNADAPAAVSALPPSDRATARRPCHGVPRSKARSDPRRTVRLKPPAVPAAGRVLCSMETGSSCMSSSGGGGSSARASPLSVNHTPRRVMRARLLT
eukprot:scaffold113980_cov24-Tisochrysis_lutea.AAC.3